MDQYEVFCAVLYLLRTGCQWRFLPSDFPKWRTLHSYFAKWSEPDPSPPCTGLSPVVPPCDPSLRLWLHLHRVRQALRIYPYVAFDARDLLTGVIPLERGRVRVRVLHALRIHGQERRLCAAPQF